jgi:hypothetical protein
VLGPICLFTGWCVCRRFTVCAPVIFGSAAAPVLVEQGLVKTDGLTDAA